MLTLLNSFSVTFHSVRPSDLPNEARAAALATDRFQVIRTLGAGGMATVLEVLDQSTCKRIALKRMHPEPDAKRYRRLLELFERENLSKLTFDAGDVTPILGE